MALVGIINPGNPGLIDYWEDTATYSDPLDLLAAFLEGMSHRWLPIEVIQRGASFDLTVLDFKSHKWRRVRVAETKERL